MNRRDAGDGVMFAFGMLIVLWPVAALVTAVAAMMFRLASPVEVAAATGVSLLLFRAIVREDRTGGWAYQVVVLTVVRIVRTAAPVPIVGTLVSIAGSTLVLWHPALVLALVAAIL